MTVFRPIFLPRVLAGVLALAAIVLVSGCTSRAQSDIFSRVNPPSGDMMGPEVWAAIDEAPQEQAYRRSNLFWLLPRYIFSKNFVADKNEREAFSSSLAWFDIGLLFLPISIKATEYHFSADSPEADGRRGLVWNPLWAYAWNEGNFRTEKEFKASGVPLLYSSVKVGEKDELQTKFLTFLWTLGPMVVKVNGNLEANQGELPISGYAATPLLLGGWGGILWSDVHLNVGERAKIVSHGPLLGALGFVYTHSDFRLERRLEDGRIDPDSEVINQRDTQRMVIGGFLWKDGSRRVNGKVERAHHGPIFAMFGWGRKDDRPTVRLFWTHVKL